MKVGAIPPLFGGLTVRGVLTANLEGAILGTEAGSPEEAGPRANAVAASVSEFTAAGSVAGFGRLELLLVRGERTSSVAAVRPDAFLLVTLDPTQGTAPVEKLAHAWASGTANADAKPQPAPSPAPAAEAVAPAPVRPAPAPAAPAQPAETARPAETPRHPTTPDPWAALRRALVRGQLTKASVHQRELSEPSHAGAGRPGSEILDAAEHERAMQLLLEGIGTVIAGDAIGGSRILRELTAASQRNLSIRWLALQWSASGALRSGSSPTARSHVKEALTIARQLDIDARAVSQWTAAEVLAQSGDHARALTWLTEARARFERIRDRWGLGRTWLAEARLMASFQREQEAAEAARKAWEVDPGWDEPPIFLARRALLRDDLPEAETIVGELSTPAADRVRALIAAIREGTVTQADAGEFLREYDAPPSVPAMLALERIASASPRFVQARDALAWMLLKLGKYAGASAVFRGLLAEELSPGDRASVMLGLGCIPDGQQAGEGAEAVSWRPASDAAPLAEGQPGDPPSPAAPSSAGPNESGGPNAVLSGRLSVFALPDLLEFLRSARRTGVLVCSSGAGMGTLRFRNGFITAAASPGTTRLGQILLRDGKVSAQALEAMAARQASEENDQLIGELLVAEGLVEASAVQQAFRRQIEQTIRELVHWKDGEFAFNRDAESPAAGTGVSVELDSQAVLLNVFKEIDEAARIRRSDVEL